MAEKQIQFRLRPELLTDDDVLINPYFFEKPVDRTVPRPNPVLSSEYSHGRSFSSLESSLSSFDNESDEDDFLSRLTSLLRRASIEEANKSVHARNPLESWVISGSPQSTLPPVGNWTGRSTGSSNSSPNGPSQVSSPTAIPPSVENDPWDLLFREAAQLSRVKSTAGESYFSNNRSFPDQSLISGAHVNPFHQIRGFGMMQPQCPQMWGQKVIDGFLGGRQLPQNRAVRVGFGCGPVVENGKCATAVPAQTAAWHSLPPQQQTQFGGSGTGAAFAGGSLVGLKRECAGTGVFIPRRYDANTNAKLTADPRKIAAKVDNGVKKSLVEGYNGISRPQLRSSSSSIPISDYDLLIARKNAEIVAKRMRSLSTPEVAISPELRLPPEWTY
ncbi:unnamed protein product [Cuscuta epithymum]|uniref:Uncharacterized protein n=1 Tax=Cuscuta epithymum TaxID=186058 RepID=A0AAV0D7G2_9ASTE|nr:unnamed protein product [Cuscuta epithymum]